jgi:ATP-dependent Lon protease
MKKSSKHLPEILPVLPVRDSVIFPRMVLPLIIKDDEYKKLVNDALKKDRMVAIAMIKDEEEPQMGAVDVYRVGTASSIIRLSKGEEGTVLVVQGIARIAISEILDSEPYQKARIERLTDKESTGKEMEGMRANILNLFNEMVELSPYLPAELVQLAQGIDPSGAMADLIVSTLNLERGKKQEILETLDVKKRLRKLTIFLNEELELQRVGRKIQDQVKKGIDKSQRDYYLREQLKAIQQELGMDKEEPSEFEELEERLRSKPLPEAVRKTADKELERLMGMNAMSSEYTVSRTYLDWLTELPWLESTKDNLDIKRAESVLNREHYDLEKIKRRILEYLAVRKLNPNLKGPILCLVGPPGTGKTSLGRSIAKALGRKFVRMSLGGVRDEAEIRGHRRTYVGALPGRIIQWIKKAGSNNPVFMLDEIDKVGADFRGDPSSALLEVLDPEQNFSFSDHYLELEFDLSNVMFIATANLLDPIPEPLRDRMEVLELAGYTGEEKVRIASRFLIPRQIAQNGLTPARVSIQKAAVKKVIEEYTREAGLRNLEREIGSICRGVARKVAEGETGKFTISEADVFEFLGHPRFTSDLGERTSVPGVATGLAWTPAGGDILFIEATMMPGQKSLVLTGQLGDVMKESAQAALSYLRSKAANLGISPDFYSEHDLHIHVPAGAIPKDGPSAGVTMLTALASLISGRPVNSKLAMTGEVTLRGSVLPVGGIKEKVLAASRNGIREVILPAGNRNDLDEIPEKIKKQLTFHLVNRVEEVLEIALAAGKKGQGRSTPVKGKKG